MLFYMYTVFHKVKKKFTDKSQTQKNVRKESRDHLKRRGMKRRGVVTTDRAQI